MSSETFSPNTPNTMNSMKGNTRKITWITLTGKDVKLCPFSKDGFVSICFTLWFGPWQKFPVTLFSLSGWSYPLLDVYTSPSWDFDSQTTSFLVINRLLYLFSSLSLSFSLSPGCFAWIFCCLLQMCREEIEWPHLTLRVNYKSNDSTNSFLISNIILFL